jgi:hypothetical protein
LLRARCELLGRIRDQEAKFFAFFGLHPGFSF